MAASIRVRLFAAVLIAASGVLTPPAWAEEPSPAPQQSTESEQAAPGAATEPAPQGVASQVADWNETLNRISAELNAPKASANSLDLTRNELEDLRTRIQSYVAEQRPRLPELEARLESLGKAPGENEPPEPAPVAAQRAELEKAVGDLKGVLKAAEEALLRLETLSDRAREKRRTLFEEQIFERGRSPLSPSLWRNISRDAPIGLKRIGFLVSNWWDGVSSRAAFFGIMLGTLAIWAALSLLAWRRIDHVREWTHSEPPSEWRRAASAGRVILLRLLPTIVASGFLYFSLVGGDLLTPPAERIIIAAIASLVIVATVQAVTMTMLAINRPHWRLMTLSHRAALKLYWHLMILSAVYGLDFFISALGRTASTPFSVSLGQSFIASLLIAGLIISILRIRENGEEDLAARPIGRSYIRTPLWLIALTILGAALIGYVSFARFIAGQLIVTSTIFIVAYLLIISVSAFGQGIGDEESRVGAWLRDHTGLEENGRRRLALPVMLVLKAAIIIGAVPLILLLWGFDRYDIGSWLRQALFGFDIGGVRISVIAVVVALLLFVLGYIAAKFFQEWLDRYVLEGAGVDAGVRDSVRTGVGYLGVALAALLAVSYLGLDFSNLAIVAGALSVGVGFGLQSIVNNFVSGLILLAERPIKAGDWIIVGAHEGIVRKISVRSTEIETFDRANVIVPNSMLITDTVKNWTLHNSTGRMPIPVGVHYDSDPEKVRDILLEVANQHPHVLSNPAPFVFFEDFGDSALNFILFVYLSNVNRSFAVRTDLRIAIVKAFREHGIEIPYPQTDIHLRDLDWIKEELKEWRASRGNGGPAARRDYQSESEEPDDAGPDSDGN